MTRKHSRITLISMLFAVLLLAVTPQFTGLLAQEEESGATQACGASPNQFGGQGFEYAGQGFEYAGQGFEYAGQDGTSIVSYTFDEINQQITDNIIDPNWVNIIFDGITDGADYGEADSAIIVLDDTDHGDLVLRTFEVLNQALISNEIQAIPIHFIDISIPSINFEASAIATALEAKVIELQEAGVDHIAVNMSFAFILCEDEETGFSYYEYLETKEIRENAEQNPEIGSAVRPVFECVYEVGNTYVARFGYLNESTDSVGIEVGRNNRLSPNNDRELLPELFEAGRQSDVFEIPFNNRRLVWTLEGPDGVRRTATAGKGRHVPRCEDDSARDYVVIEDDYHGHHAWLWKWLLKWKWNWLNGNNGNQGYVPHWYHDLFRQSHPDTYERREATVGVTPVVECVYIVSTIDDNLSLYRAQFGYTNTTDNTIYLPVGSSNMVGNTAIPAQPTYFLPGERQAVFEAEFYSNSSVTWTVLGANGEVTSATASALVDEDEDGIPDNFNICVESEGYTLGDYFAELGLDPDEITSTLIRLLLFQNSDGESLEDDSTLLPLRNLLASFLANNIESENKQTVITFASSGNYAPWFRDALGLGVFDPVPPLIPAAWNETIAVAATIGDDVVDTNEDGIADAIGRDNSFDGTQWVMSQDGDLRAPGAGYDISNETEQLAVAGTSFAAPSATVIGALYGRYPHACESVVLANPDGSASYYPPLDVVNSLDSTPLIFGPDNPLRCNIAPNAIDYSFTLDEGVGEGEEGESNVLVDNLLTDNLQDPDNDAGTLDFALVTGEESGPFAGEVNVNPDGTFEYFFFGNP
ncbi:MAG: S8 family serine peptidase, partial [Chloroflexota bacterium]